MAPYWSIEVVGIQRPRTSVSFGPASSNVGNLPKIWPPCTAPPRHQVMAAPGVIAAVGRGGLEGAAEIGLGESRYVLRHAEFLRRVVEGGERGAQLRIERVVRLELAGVRIEAAQGTEENLAAHSQIRLHLNDLRHLLQLRADAGGGKRGLQAAVDFASAVASAAASLMLFESVSLAACTRETPLSVVSSVLSAFKRACDAVERGIPSSCRDRPGASATGCVFAPVPSRAFPATEKNVGKLDELMFCAAM